VAVALGIGVVGVGVAWGIASHRNAPRANGAVVVTPLAVDSAPAVATLDPSPPPPVDSAVAAPSTAASHVKPTSSARAPNARPVDANHAPRAATPPPAPRISCDPPYRIDSSGNKQWKRECL
jgi:hypothetical protein